MDVIRSRQNPLVKKLIALASDSALRQQLGQFVCAGQTLLEEAVSSGMEIPCVLAEREIPGLPVHLATAEIVQAASPLQHSSGPVFTVKTPSLPHPDILRRVLILENVQDPGNVGTVVRTADGLGIDLVVLCGACADPHNPKAVRSSMGAIFRQPLQKLSLQELPALLGDLPLFGAALQPGGLDIRALPTPPVAVAVGNEGSGLSPALLTLCGNTVRIPLCAPAESYNAGVAAALCMWEMVRSSLPAAGEGGAWQS